MHSLPSAKEFEMKRRTSYTWPFPCQCARPSLPTFRLSDSMSGAGAAATLCGGLCCGRRASEDCLNPQSASRYAWPISAALCRSLQGLEFRWALSLKAPPSRWNACRPTSSVTSASHALSSRHSHTNMKLKRSERCAQCLCT